MSKAIISFLGSKTDLRYFQSGSNRHKACAQFVARSTELLNSITNQPELYISANDISPNQPKTNGVFSCLRVVKKEDDRR